LNIEIFDRQIRLFKELNSGLDGVASQKRIEDSHVVILGVGGIGSNIAVGLAQSGTKKITIVDFDLVESSNINRTVGYSLNSVGKKKTKVLSNYIIRNYPWCKINPIEAKILSRKDFQRILDRLNSIDLVVNCIDRPINTRYYISDICVERSIPFIKGGYSGYFGAIGPFYIPKISACQYCFDSFLFPEESNTTNKNYSNVPSASSSWITQTISSLMLRDIIGFITSAYKVLAANTYLQIDFLNMTFDKIDVKTNENCKNSCVSSIDAQDFRIPFSKDFTDKLEVE
jgi:molybdopterin/thiamine biosynthesis adenylyltransferase